jgi:hypothetical protein
MNLTLLDPFSHNELPEVIETKLDVPHGVRVCAFNRRGTLLAGGCDSGHVLVWDFETHGQARALALHDAPVSAVSWTKSSRRLLSSGLDGRLVVWDVLRGAVLEQTALPETELTWSSTHPLCRSVCLTCSSSRTAIFRQVFLHHWGATQNRDQVLHSPEFLAGGTAIEHLLRPVRVLVGGPHSPTNSPFPPPSLYPLRDQVLHSPDEPEAPAPADGGSTAASVAASSRRPPPLVACFDRPGERVLIADSKGMVTLLSLAGEALASLQLAGGAAVKSMSVSRDGKCATSVCFLFSLVRGWSRCSRSRGRPWRRYSWRGCRSQVDECLKGWQVRNLCLFPFLFGKGMVTLLSLEGEALASLQLAGGAAVKSMSVSRDGKCATSVCFLFSLVRGWSRCSRSRGRSWRRYSLPGVPQSSR